MKHRIRNGLGIASLALSLTLAGAAGVSAQEKLRFSSFEPPSAAQTSKVMVPWAEEVSKASGGKLQIDVFPGGTLGRPPQQLKLVQDGVADIAWISTTYSPGRFDDLDVLNLPFLVNSAAEGSVVLWRMFQRGELQGFDDIKLLAIASTPPQRLHSTKPINSLDDMKGKRLRVAGGLYVDFAKQLGAVPVTLAGGEIAEGLARGVVDMTFGNWGFVGDFKINEVTSHHVQVSLGTTVLLIAMNKSKYESLSPELRALIDSKSGEVLSRKLATVFDDQDRDYPARFVASGKNTIVTPNAAQQAAWEKALEPVARQWREARPRNEAIYQSVVGELKKVREPKS